MIRVAVPPGVGDVYWALSKLKAWKADRGSPRVHMVIQGRPGVSTGVHARAGMWSEMVDFVDRVSFERFKPDHRALTYGLGSMADGTPILWPNTIVDRGERIETWLPHLACDLDFPVRTTHFPGGPRNVLYVSSDGINTAWMAQLPRGYWYDLIRELNRAVGRVSIIGAGWDTTFFSRLMAEAPFPLDVEPLLERTNLMQVADVLKSARFVCGVISGMTILANHFQTPCVAFYPTAHHEDFPRAWIKPGTPYWPIRVDRVPTAVELAATIRGVARGADCAPAASL